MSTTRETRTSKRLERRNSTGPYAGSAPGTSVGSTGLTSYMAGTTLDWQEAAAAEPSSGSRICRTISRFASRKKGKDTSDSQKDMGKDGSQKRTSARSSTRKAPAPPSGEQLVVKVERPLGTGLGIHVASSTVASTVTVCAALFTMIPPGVRVRLPTIAPRNAFLPASRSWWCLARPETKRASSSAT